MAIVKETANYPEIPPEMHRLYNEFEWPGLAACAEGDPESHYPDASDTTAIAAAKQVCASCPVIDECLVSALANKEEYGVRAGLSEEDRGYDHSMDELSDVLSVVEAVRAEPLLLERMPLLLPSSARTLFLETLKQAEAAPGTSISDENGSLPYVTDRLVAIGTMLLGGSFDYHQWYQDTRGSDLKNVITFLLKIDVDFAKNATLETLRAKARDELEEHFHFIHNARPTLVQNCQIIADLYGLDDGISLSHETVAINNKMKKRQLEKFLINAFGNYAKNRPKNRPAADIETYTEPVNTPVAVIERAIAKLAIEEQRALTRLLGLAPDSQPLNDLDIAEHSDTTLEDTRRSLKLAVTGLGKVLQEGTSAQPSGGLYPDLTVMEITLSSLGDIVAETEKIDFYKAILPMTGWAHSQDGQRHGAEGKRISVVIAQDNAITIEGQIINLTPNDVAIFNLMLLLGEDPRCAADYKATDIADTPLAEFRAFGVQFKELARKFEKVAGFPVLSYKGDGNQRMYIVTATLDLQDNRIYDGDITQLAQKLEDNRNRAIIFGEKQRISINTKNALVGMRELIVARGDNITPLPTAKYDNKILEVSHDGQIISDYAHFARIVAANQSLDPKAETALFGAIHRGVDIYFYQLGLGKNDAHDTRAFNDALVAYNQLQLSSLRVVKTVVDRLFNEFDPKKVSALAGDLLQEGVCQLAACIATYDADRGSKFADYAGGIIYSKLRSLRDSDLRWGDAGQLKIPTKKRRVQTAIRKAGDNEMPATGMAEIKTANNAPMITSPITDDLLQIADESYSNNSESESRIAEIATQLAKVFDTDILSNNEKIILSLYFQIYIPSLVGKCYQARLSVEKYDYDTIFQKLANREQVSLDGISEVLLLPRGTALQTKQRAIKKIQATINTSAA